MSRLLLRLFTITIVFGMTHSQTAAMEATSASGAIPWCASYCDAGVSCDAVCEDEGGFPGCGPWSNYDVDSCDVMGWNSCDFACPKIGDPEDECIDGGDVQTCDEFGQYAYCGDGYCAVQLGEDDSSCSADCEVPTDIEAPPTNEPEEQDWTALGEEMASVCSSGGDSLEDGNAMLAVAYSMGFVDELIYVEFDGPAPTPLHSATVGQLEGAADGPALAEGDAMPFDPYDDFVGCMKYAGIGAGASMTLHYILLGVLGVGVWCTPCAASAAATAVIISAGEVFFAGASIGKAALCLWDYAYALLV